MSVKKNQPTQRDMDANPAKVRVPVYATLRKYGWTEGDWVFQYQLQRGLCQLCRRPFLEGKPIHIDHHHVRGWKKMKPELRRKYVRGLLHYFCNRFLLGPCRYGFKAEHYRLAADYLERHGT